ncbi:hypothetical protein [Algibacter lectus]|uniref:hypothetical protein n=1 Tax=Algibacter lectus TaxID=221126 RepID=UPI0024957559|nr:hypothetical protein [Algibacter lectus]
MGKIKSKLERKKEIQDMYDVYVNAWGGYADEPKEAPVVEIIEGIAKDIGLPPSYLFTIATGEGLGWIYLSDLKNYKNGKVITDKKISGFQNFGLDFFGNPKEWPNLKKYLPKTYNEGDEFVSIAEKRDEAYGKETVYSADFKNLESSIWAMAAVLKQRADRFERDWNELNYIKPTEDEWAFWTYFYYQRPELAFQRIKELKSYDIFYLKTSDRTKIRTKALERVAAWRYIQYYNIFST